MAEISIPQVKACSKCGAVKPLELFVKERRQKSGRGSRCKACVASNAARWLKDNADRHRATTTEWWRKHGKTWSAQRRRDNPEKIKGYKKVEYNRHRSEIISRVAIWRQNNPEKRKALARSWSRRQMSTPRGRIDKAISGGIAGNLNGTKAGRSWEQLVGYTVDDLMLHLEALFQPGMTWANYGRHGWHVDHVIPRAAFNYQSPEHIDFHRCWAMANLQPLWAEDNLRKGAKLTAPFQPSLAI